MRYQPIRTNYTITSRHWGKGNGERHGQWTPTLCAPVMPLRAHGVIWPSNVEQFLKYFSVVFWNKILLGKSNMKKSFLCLFF